MLTGTSKNLAIALLSRQSQAIITQMCSQIDIDLRGMLDEDDIPSLPPPQNNIIL